MPMKLYILTCQRGGDAKYAPDLVRQLSEQPWAGERIIWCDGDPDDETIEAALDSARAGVSWRVQPNKRQGPPNTAPFFDLIRDAWASPDRSDILFLEDDVRVCRNFLPFVEQMGCPEPFAYLSWFEAMLSRNAQVGGLIAGPASAVVPSQARTISARFFRALIGLRGGPRWNPSTGCDANMAEALREQVMAFHVPALVQHVGAVSAANAGVTLHASGRRSDAFVGEDFDALALAADIPKLQAFAKAMTREAATPPVYTRGR